MRCSEKNNVLIIRRSKNDKWFAVFDNKGILKGGYEQDCANHLSLNYSKVQPKPTLKGDSDYLDWAAVPLTTKEKIINALNQLRHTVFGVGSIVTETPVLFYEKIMQYIPFDNRGRAAEIGCGSGQFVRFLLTSGYEEIAVLDSSSAQLERVRSLYKTNKVKIYQMRAESLPWKNNQFDIVANFFVLEHLIRVPDVLKEMVRVTKPRGKLVMAVPLTKGSPEVLNLLRGDVSFFVLPETCTCKHQMLPDGFFCLDREIPRAGAKLLRRFLFAIQSDFAELHIKQTNSPLQATQALYIAQK
ncbi:MAG: class I SAM-dependent methyltransferase [candidate division WOR-3 bacterium]